MTTVEYRKQINGLSKGLQPVKILHDRLLSASEDSECSGTEQPLSQEKAATNEFPAF